MASMIAIVIVLCATCQLIDQITANTPAGNKIYEKPGVMADQILRQRGFRVEDYLMTTKDNYKILLRRAWNPLIITPELEQPHGTPSESCDRGRPNKIPILFVHGILNSFNVFVMNSFGATAKDFSNISLAWETANQSIARLANEPSAKSLPLLALNHGHEIWLMSRRGFPGSRTQIGNPITGDTSESSPTHNGPFSALLGSLLGIIDLAQYPFSFNRRFWDFSLDQQARFDLPQAVDFVLNKTCRKQLSVVGHSAGGALTLMALTLYPEMNHKIQNAILWSESFNLGYNDKWAHLKLLRPILERFQSATPPSFITGPFQGLAGFLCSYKWIQRWLCSVVVDLLTGYSGLEAPLEPEFMSGYIHPSSAQEIAQLMQSASKGNHMHQYDYGPRRNRIFYGHSEVEPYNLSRITLDKMSFWSAATDTLVTPDDVEATQKLLRVPSRSRLLRAPFNHLGYFMHKDVAQLVTIPTLREIQQFSERNGAD